MMLLPEPRTAQEVSYNRAHMTTQASVERAIGILKQRFKYVTINKWRNNMPINIHYDIVHHTQKKIKTEMIITSNNPMDKARPVLGVIFFTPFIKWVNDIVFKAFSGQQTLQSM